MLTSCREDEAAFILVLVAVVLDVVDEVDPRGSFMAGAWVAWNRDTVLFTADEVDGGPGVALLPTGVVGDGGTGVVAAERSVVPVDALDTTDDVEAAACIGSE